MPAAQIPSVVRRSGACCCHRRVVGFLLPGSICPQWDLLVGQSDRTQGGGASRRAQVPRPRRAAVIEPMWDCKGLACINIAIAIAIAIGCALYRRDGMKDYNQRG